MSDIVQAARRWIGTPYQHQASVRGAGCDCLGLVRGVWREMVGAEAEVPPPYTPDWARERGEETLLAAARRHLVFLDAPCPGDVIAFRLRAGLPVTHLGIHAGAGEAGESFIHAYARRGVVETPLGPYWRRRLSHSFRFPI